MTVAVFLISLPFMVATLLGFTRELASRIVGGF